MYSVIFSIVIFLLISFPQIHSSAVWITSLVSDCQLAMCTVRSMSTLLCTDPALIGQAFVRQYYTQMHKDPCQMHRFYMSNSSFVHGGSDVGSEEPVIGQTVREGRNYTTLSNVKNGRS